MKPKTNAIIAIVTSERFEYFRNNPHDVNVDILIDQNHFERDLKVDQLKANHLHLVIDGGHGSADFSDGSPTYLNDKPVAVIHSQINALKAKNLKFKSIHLSSCYSATFIPLFHDLLTDNGIIFCHTLSSTARAENVLNTTPEQDKDLFSVGFAALAYKIKELNELNSRDCFISDAVYTQEDRTLHRFNISDSHRAFNIHNALIDANKDDSEHDGHLYLIEQYLHTQGIFVDDSSTSDHELEILVREKSFPRKLRQIVTEDIDLISALDQSIFPDEEPLNLSHCHDKEYSWLIHDDHDDRVLSYIFVTKTKEHELFIHNLGTLPDARKKGLARVLLKQVIKQAEVSDSSIRLRVRANNEAATNLYKKFGFIAEAGDDDLEWLYMQRASPSTRRLNISTEHPAINPSNTAPHEIKIDDWSFYIKCLGGMVAAAGGAMLVIALLLTAPKLAIAGACLLGAGVAIGYFFSSQPSKNETSSHLSPQGATPS